MGRQQFMQTRLPVDPDTIADLYQLAADFQTVSTTHTPYDTITYSIFCTSVTDNLGAFGIQYRPSDKAGWIDLTLDSVPTLADVDASFAVSASQLGAGEVRLVFIAAGGAPDGEADVWVAGKKVGA